MNYQNILARACGQPLAFEPSYARTFFSVLADRAGAKSLIDINGEVLAQAEIKQELNHYTSSGSQYRPYAVHDGIAMVSITGSLAHKFGSIKPKSGMTGYDGIYQQIQMAVSDQAVNGILLDIDSPGGEVAGCFDLAEMIYQLNQVKPIASLCYEQTTSAAQMLASSCGYRYITQSGIAGSVGVLMAHTSMENSLKNSGVEITLIYSGKEKVNGNPYQNLSADVHQKMQASADKMRDQFANRVARYSGMDKQVILDTQAAIYRGQEAIDIGFANELINGNEALSAFKERIQSLSTSTVTTGASMKEDDVAEKETISGKKPEAAMTAAAMQQRMGAILKSESALGLSALANHLAFDTLLEADVCEGVFKAAMTDLSAIQTTQTTAEDKGKLETAFEKQMKQSGSLNLGADSESETDAELADLGAAFDRIA